MFIKKQGQNIKNFQFCLSVIKITRYYLNLCIIEDKKVSLFRKHQISLSGRKRRRRINGT
jgi:hypothetical protein